MTKWSANIVCQWAEVEHSISVSLRDEELITGM